MTPALLLTHDRLAELRYHTLLLPGEVDRAIDGYTRILFSIRAQDDHVPDLARVMRNLVGAVKQDLGSDLL